MRRGSAAKRRLRGRPAAQGEEVSDSESSGWKDVGEGVGCILVAVAIAIIIWALSGFPGVLR